LIKLRIGTKETTVSEEQLGEWIAEGRVPPDALVFSVPLTGGLWKQAKQLERYHFFRDSGNLERQEKYRRHDGEAPFADLPRLVFPKRGFSGTELLLAINVLVALALLLLWGGSYTERIFSRTTFVSGHGEGLAWDFYNLFVDKKVPVGFVASLFVHAGLSHFGANMISLLPSAGFAEYFFGRRVYLIYLIGGLGGAAASFLVKNHGPMSVGASGAIYALIGASVGFVIRYYAKMRQWQRWRARRIYVPILMLAVLPSIFNADWRAHVGGFLSGVILGLVLQTSGRVRKLIAAPINGESS